MYVVVVLGASSSVSEVEVWIWVFGELDIFVRIVCALCFVGEWREFEKWINTYLYE